MRRINDILDVVRWRMCLGCGACAYICSNKRIQLYDMYTEGIRPGFNGNECSLCKKCLSVCPAIQSDFSQDCFESDKNNRCKDNGPWGQVKEIWEGYATDPDIRFKGASGGALTAIAMYCLEKRGMSGVLHIGQDPDDPIRNKTRLSSSRNSLIDATGSRYSPASVCDGLGLVESAENPCVIIGKPAEIAAVRNARKINIKLDRNIGITLSFFCAETPSTRATIDLLKAQGISPEAVSDLRYRGMGWPGYFTVKCDKNGEPRQLMSYQKSWEILQAYRPWSVQLWPDSSGELADITCGDPWYTTPDGINPGFSLVLARTELGCTILREAIETGYLTLSRAEDWKLTKSQSGLLVKKGSIWGRRMILRLFGLPITKLNGLSLWSSWLSISYRQKLRSTLGTLRRVLTRRLYKPMVVNISNSKGLRTS